MPVKIAREIPEHTDRIEAARYLCWMFQEISSTAIAEGLLGVHPSQMRGIVGPAIGPIQCDRCSTPMAFRTRAHFKEVITNVRKFRLKGHAPYAEGYVVLCDRCWEEVHQVRHEQFEAEWAKREARLNQLTKMPYSEYLQTPEWQERRKQHLKSSGYRCQVCNSTGVVLNVHHRRYERRGKEYYKDLLTLCETCHELFHREGRLAPT